MTCTGLFDAITLGSLDLANRVVMAPLTRGRATTDNIPTAMMATYYAQRADCGLIVSEATGVDRMGTGWYRVPGIWTDPMVEGWKRVTDAVHDAGGRIVCQLWHMGRCALPDYLGGEPPIGPSAIAAQGEAFAPREPGDTGMFLPMKPYVVPREMTQTDIDRAVACFALGAENAVRAGFDGVEIHAANGYLIDEFLQSSSNRRVDGYGGGVEKRVRFLREVVEAVTSKIEPGRVGIRISPTSNRKGMGDEDPSRLAAAIGQVVQDAGLAYIHLIEAVAPGFTDVPEDPVMEHLRSSYKGKVIQNGGFDRHSADSFVASGHADAISFGRPFIANPDLVNRMKCGAALADPNMDYAYVGDEKGYIDYASCA